MSDTAAAQRIPSAGEPSPLTIGDPSYQPTKLLSLIVPARNDSYMGDFKWRFSTCLNYLARNLKDIGRLDDVEVVVCDWNSDDPLHKHLPLSEDAQRLVRFVVVPPAIATPAQKDSVFPIVLAQNAVIRRARGQFIGQTDSDVLYSHSSLLALFSVLDGKIPGVPLPNVYLCAPRRHIPFTMVTRQPTMQELDEYICRSSGLLKEEPPSIGFAAPTTLVLMHRSMWEQTHGYNENYLYWGWMDSDLTLRVTQQYPMLYLSSFGVNLVHLEHYRVRNYQDRQHQPRKLNPCNDMPAFTANDANWGLAQHSFMSHRAELIAAAPQPKPHDPSEIAVWSITPTELQQQLNEPPVQQAVNQIIQKFQIPPFDQACLHALSWYSTYHSPRTYFEIGLRSAHAAALVTMTSPGVELYGIVEWHRPTHDERSFAHGAHFALLPVMQQSHARWIGGDPLTAVERVAKSNAGRFAVDLALVRADNNLPHGTTQAVQLVPWITPGGAMVIAGVDPVSFLNTWNALSRAYPQLTFLNLNDGRTGVILKAKIAAATPVPSNPAGIPSTVSVS